MLDAPLTTPAASRDAITRYARATSPDGWLTADGWLRLAADLAAAGARLSGDRRLAHEDRSRDCFERAARLLRGAL